MNAWLGLGFGWPIAAVLLIALAALIGRRNQMYGILIDSRGRYSLTQFQLVAWTITIVSLLAGVVTARLMSSAYTTALEFTIPPEIFGVLGISAGSTVLSIATKSAKDNDPEQSMRVITSDPIDNPPHWRQIFTVEEGALADRTIDVTKFQNFLFTTVLLVSYVATAIGAFRGMALEQKGPEAISQLPTFGPQFLILLGISHAGYLTGKIPNKAGEVEHSVASRKFARSNLVNARLSTVPLAAAAGAPGSWTPQASDPPADVATLQSLGLEIIANPPGAWQSGQYVKLMDGSRAHWTGTKWMAGEAT